MQERTALPGVLLNDTAWKQIADGGDTVECEDGRDTMVVNGVSNVAVHVEISANGHRVLFTAMPPSAPIGVPASAGPVSSG